MDIQVFPSLEQFEKDGKMLIYLNVGVLRDDFKQPSTLQLNFLEKAQVTAYL